MSFSSQFSSSDHAAFQLLGVPKHYPAAGSAIRCWAWPGSLGVPVEKVRLGF